MPPSIELSTRRTRAWFAASVTVFAILVAHASYAHQAAGAMSDFDQAWIAARALRSGLDPYDAVARTGWPFPFYYPATAAVVVLPLTWISLPWARAVFMGVGTGLCAWALTRRSYWPALGLASGSYFSALVLAQWSPLLVGGAFLPPLAAGAVLSAKPTVGLALVIAWFLFDRRSLMLATGGAAFAAAVGLVLNPGWPVAWMHAIASAPHIVPLFTLLPLGPFLLAAAARWRTPEARLLLAMACVPMTPALYESLAVFLVPRTRREVLVLALLADVAWGLSLLVQPHQVLGAAQLALQQSRSGTIAIGLVYLPCLVMVLRRPNEGPTPAWLERLIVRMRTTLTLLPVRSRK